MVIFGLMLALAADEPAPTDDAEIAETVVVYSRAQVEQAKDEVIHELKRLGYDKAIQKDGAVVMRHHDAWKGDVWLHDDGWMRIRRQPVRIEAPATPFSRAGTAGAWVGCILLPFRCVRAGGQMVSKRKFIQVETRTVGTVAPEVSQWGDRVADYQVSTKVLGLPDRLADLWERGIPLEGEVELATVDERKAAILRYWETRTDNPWGEAVRASVESFIRGEVQYSEAPFTEEEIALFNRRSRAGRALSLTRQR